MQNNNQDSFPRINIKPMGEAETGEDVFLYSLVNEQGMKVDITNYGGIIVRLFAPDRSGRMQDIVLGYNDLDSYMDNPAYFGALIGRFANRISGGEFSLGGKKYSLEQNEKEENFANHLHGGSRGFHSVVWEARPLMGVQTGLRLNYSSADGEGGYPGNLEVEVDYILTADNVLRLEYRVETDKPTPLNLTNHSYFNLRGEGRGDILTHVVSLNSEEITPVNEALIPTGEFMSVADTPFDFRSPQEIGSRIKQDHPQLKIGGGYDHNYVISGAQGELTRAAEVYEPWSGRKMTVHTTEPGVQFYTGNSLSEQPGKSGRKYYRHSGFCLETQHYPDSVNHENFPSVILQPGEVFNSVTEFAFSTEG